MALSPTAAEISTKNNNVETNNNAGTNNTRTNNNGNSQSLMQNKLEGFQNVKDYLGTFLEDSEMGQLRKTARFLRYTNQKDVDKKKTAKRVRKEFLVHAFGASPDAANLFLSNPVNERSLLLIKTHFHEGYDSNKFKEFVCFREWRNVSFIQAIALSGDECFLRKIIADYISMNDKLRVEAATQLEEVQKKISENKTIKILMDAIAAIIDLNLHANPDLVKAKAKTRLAEIQRKPEFQQQMQEFIDEMEELRRQIKEKTNRMWQTNAERAKRGNNVVEQKLDAEKKNNKENVQIKVENSQIKYADNTEFLAPVLKLLKAYVYFFIQYHDLYLQRKFDKIEELWEYVGECQKRLPHYIIQEFFNSCFSINTPPDFTTDPRRAPCRYWNKELLDLDSLGIGTFHGLYRGSSLWRGRGCAWVRFYMGELVDDLSSSNRWEVSCLLADFASIAHLYKLRAYTADLGNIIDLLREPETTKTLVPAIYGFGA